MSAVPVLVVTDHLQYIRERQHRRATHAAIRRIIRKRRSGTFQVLHEADGLCCRIEPWAETAARIRAALAADGEGGVLWAAFGVEGAA